MKNATLRQLRTFEVVARHLSMSAAARDLHLSQPAVSMQIQALEEECGVALLETVGRKLFLTEAGREVAASARAMRNELRDLEDRLSSLGALKVGHLNVGIISTAKYFAPALLARFLRSHPGASVRIDAQNRQNLINLLANNEVDCAIMGRPPESMDVIARPFGNNPHGLIVAGDHALARTLSIGMQDLARETFLIREQGSGTRELMERYFLSRRFHPAAMMEMSSNETIKQAVAVGLGVSFLSLCTVGAELESGRLACLQLPGLPIVRRWYTVQRQSKRPSSMARSFLEFVHEEAEDVLAAVLKNGYPRETTHAR